MTTGKKGIQANPSPLERAADRFIKTWSLWERAFGRTSSALARRMRFSFFLAMTLVALVVLYWDFQGFGIWYGHEMGGFRWLSSVEDSLFDTVISRRPLDPPVSGRVVIAEIDQCSIDYFTRKGETGWPWPRDRHADLLTAMGDAGVAAVGYDVMFLDKQSEQAGSDDMLLQVAQLGVPTFFGSMYVGPDSTVPPINQWHGPSMPLIAKPRDAPRIAIRTPYGEAMAKRSGYVDIKRSDDGVQRDFKVWEKAGDWAVPSMAALVAAQATGRKFTSFPDTIRLNWTPHHPLQVISAVDFLPDAHMPCPIAGGGMPDLKGKVVLVGYNAAGINDIKPTPIDSQMPGVVLQAEAVENLISGTWIRMPDDGFKYGLAAVLIVLIGFSFWRGEPSQDIDAVFTATNLLLTAVAVLTLTFTTYFFDIFTTVGISLTFFGICRTYLAGMRGRALGNDDHVPELGEHGRLHVVLLLLRVSVGHDLETAGHNPDAKRFWETNEYRRRIRRVLYGHGYAKIHEGLIERKTFLAADFRDVILMICDAPSVEELRWEILHDLRLINDELNKIADEIRIDQIATASAAYIDLSGLDEQTRAMSLQNTLGKVLQLPATTNLRAFIAADVDCLPRYVNPYTSEKPPPEEPPCAIPSES